MKGQTNLTQADFDSLLNWLDSDREQAGRKYEQVRQRLIKIFTCRKRPDAEELADVVINRVTLKAEELAKGYVGDPSLYFYGVAQKVYLECVRKLPAAVFVPPTSPPTDEEEAEYECLEACVGRLPEDSRALVIEYYEDDKRAKIDHRKELASRLGIAQNALRIRAHRIRLSLQRCVEECLARGLPE